MKVPVGTWMVSAKIEDKELYNKAKSGEIKGFSIEGYFADRLDMSNQESDIINKLKELLK